MNFFESGLPGLNFTPRNHFACLLSCLSHFQVVSCMIPWILENIVGNKERHSVIPCRMKLEHQPEDLST